MPLVTEDGTGKSDAESYISVAEAQAYFLLNGEPDAWITARLDKQETALRVATRAIDLMRSGRWNGIRFNSSQALAWPRFGVYDDDGFALPASPLPKNLRLAAAQLALRYLQDPDSVLGDEASDDRNIIGESVSVGPLSESKTYSGSKATKKRFPEIDLLLVSLAFGSALGSFERA